MITGSPSLRVLDVSWNNIGDDGISLYLQHINTVTELSVKRCRLSVKVVCIVLIATVSSYIATL